MVIPKLPYDLESEILSRVPPTSVIRLQLTCKRWYAVFKDSRFINKHLGKAATQMVLKNDEWVYSFNFDFHGVSKRYDQFITFTGKLMSLEDSEDVKISEIFHCEGLLLCTTTKDSSLVVWNPCTGQTRWIQSNGYNMDHQYFLGYGNKNKSCDDSFKILKYSYDDYHENAKFEIYEFNSDSWRVLDTDTAAWETIPVGVSLKGNTYWLNSDEDDCVNFILRFDFTTERFEHLSLPFHNDEYDAGIVLSVVREEKLALLFQSFVSSSPLEMKIWVTNTKAKDYFSWSEFLVVDFSKFTPCVMMRVISFLVDEENKRVMCCHQDCEDQERAIVYVAGEDIHKIVYREYFPNETYYSDGSPELLSYVPSLVQIPAKQSTPGG